MSMETRTGEGLRVKPAGTAGMLLLCLCTLAAGARAQAPTVSGAILDATTGRPLDGATVSLAPAPAGLLRSADGALVPMRVAVTGADGRYRFDDVVPGRYRLRIERLGFRGDGLETVVRGPVDTRISVALELEPLALVPVAVEERAAAPFRRVAGVPGDLDEARLALERERQATYLTPDSRTVTLADVSDGVTLGENDVFRALQRFPGIATRDDYTAELWTRGAPWAETRITFDDVPLFNPVHAVGVFSGVAADALGAVVLHSGVRTAGLGAGSAGAVELRSRTAAGDGALRGATDVSMAMAKLTLEQRPGGGAGAWLVSLRRSYLDLFTDGYDWLGLGELDLPYAFHDVTVRGDAPLGRTAALEASALWEEDRLYGDVDDVVERTNAAWGNAAGRVTLRASAGGLAVRQHVGVSRYRASIREAGDSLLDERGLPWIEPETDNELLHLQFAGAVMPAGLEGAAPWAAGWELVRQELRYDGPEPRLHPVRPDTSRRIARDDALTRAAAWLEVRASAGVFDVQPGVRVEGGSSARGAPRVRVAPRVQTRVRVDRHTNVSLAAGRTWQDLQALGVAGPSAHPAFHAGQFWLQAGELVPALRADLLTAGIERWLGDRWLATVSAYVRAADGVVLPDPRAGSLARRPLFVTGTGRARGVESSVRRVAGRWTVSAGWTVAHAEVTANGHTHPAPADRRHRVDASAAVRLPAGLRIGGAWMAMSGAPYTRVFARAPSPECDLFGFGCGQVVASVEAPNAERTPGYRSLDAMLVWARTLRDVDVSAYVQVRNVLDRDNASTYSGTVPRVVRGRDGAVRVEWIDRFEAGLPRLPLVGARIAF